MATTPRRCCGKMRSSRGGRDPRFILPEIPSGHPEDVIGFPPSVGGIAYRNIEWRSRGCLRRPRASLHNQALPHWGRRWFQVSVYASASLSICWASRCSAYPCMRGAALIRTIVCITRKMSSNGCRSTPRVPLPSKPEKCGGRRQAANCHISSKPPFKRKRSSKLIATRLRKKFARCATVPTAASCCSRLPIRHLSTIS